MCENLNVTCNAEYWTINNRSTNLHAVCGMQYAMHENTIKMHLTGINDDALEIQTVHRRLDS